MSLFSRFRNLFAESTAASTPRMDLGTGSSTTTGGYRGAKRGRRVTGDWLPKAGSANADTLPGLTDLRARSRDLLRNMPIAAGAISTNVTNVVGEGLICRPSLNAELLGISEDEAEAWEKAATAEFALACRSLDWTREASFEERQQLMIRSPLENGDLFILLRYRRDPGDVYGAKIQLIEADRVSNPHHRADTATMIAGINFDANGVPRSIHVSDQHPGDTRRQAMTWQEIPIFDAAGRRQVLHLHDQLRVDQARGVPYLAPVVEALRELSNYADAEVRAAVVTAMITVFITEDPEMADGDGRPPMGDRVDGTEADIKLGNGAIVGLPAGMKPAPFNPQRPNPQFDGFVQAFLRMIGVALELPFEVLIKHFTASYSASRAALEMAWQYFRKRRTWLARRAIVPIYERVIFEAVASGRLAAPGFFTDPLIRQLWCAVEVIGPSRASIDPRKEAEADEIDIANGVKTIEQVIMERTGGTFSSKHAQRSRESRARRDAGLEADIAAPRPARTDPQPGDQP